MAASSARGVLQRCRAVVFDCDDTIIAATKTRWSILIRTAASFDMSIDEDMIREVRRLPFDNMVARLVPDAPHREFVARYSAAIGKAAAKPAEGAAELVGHLRARGVVLHIVTSGFRELVLRDLAAFNLAGAFDYMCGQEDLDCSKPDPRVLAPSIHRLSNDGVSAENAVYIGDSVKDYQVAAGNQMPFIAVLTGLDDKAEFRAAGLSAHHIVENLGELLATGGRPG